MSVIEYGCGFGNFTDYIHKSLSPEDFVLGVDISETAIEKAKQRYPDLLFSVGDILDENILKSAVPDVVILAEITWYILDKVKPFLELLRKINPDVVIIHLLNVYPEGEQKYGLDYFKDLNGILQYFDLDYSEYGKISNLVLYGSCRRTFLVGKFK